MSTRLDGVTVRARPDAKSAFSIPAIIRRVMWALQVSGERRALLSLDDDALKDIGLTRFDARREGKRSLFDLPDRCARRRR
jgi:uncharacterized protein YjiS (DUF1127 family)